MEQVKLTIDGIQVEVDKGTTVIEAARKVGIDIPSLCYDPRIEPFGACRLCFVNIEGAPKPATACSTVVTDGMVVTTEDELLKQIRKTALELLLSDHYGDCVAPCKLACPASIDIQGFVAYIADGQFEEAGKLIKEQLPLPASVGRVCPRFCEDACRRNIVDEPIAICTLKAKAGDSLLNSENPYTPTVAPDTGKKVAIIGGGPAGLTAAYYIRLQGHQVTIFEAEEKLGGMMRFGIPEYRLPAKLLDTEIGEILKLGIDVKYNTKFGRDFTIDTLKEEGYDAIFIGVGCQKDTQVNLEGRDAKGVYSGIELLREVAYGREVDLGEKTVIVGGGNTAMDAARTAVRLGVKEITVVYRRTEKEMPADPREIVEAKEEGVKFRFLANPKSIKYDDRVTAVECIEMELGEPDASGRRRPVPVENSEFLIEADSVVLAIGQGVDTSCIEGSEAVKLNHWDCIDVDEGTLVTSVEGVFAAGDCVLGASTVVEAVGQGKKAATSIIKYLNGEPLVPEVEPYNCTKGKNLEDIDPEEFKDVERRPRVRQTIMAPEERMDNFKEIDPGFTDEEAIEESKRCLSCGCKDVFDCRLRELATRYNVKDEEITKLEYRHPIISDHDYIVRDPNKCVLCGNCIRICKEVQGVSALGFVKRGLETTVKPSLELPLSETNCESCRQCVSACPTGALDIKVDMPQPGPWNARKVDAICPNCGVGCNLELRVAGDKIVKITSPLASEVNKGNLCKKGAFLYSKHDSENRQKTPMVADNNALKEATWEDAIEKAVSGLKEFNPEEVAVLVANKTTNEVAYLAQKFARETLGTANIDNFGCSVVRVDNKVKDGFDAIEKSDFVLLYNVDPAADYSVIANRIRMAVRKGTKLGIISGDVTKLNPVSQVALTVENGDFQEVLDAFVNYLKLSDESKLKAAVGVLPQLSNPESLSELIKLYKNAERPVVICDATKVSDRELALLEALAEVLILQPEGNNFGLKEMGVDPAYLPNGIKADKVGLTSCEVLEKIKAKELKALFVIADEDGVPAEFISEDVFTVVITPIYEEVLEKVDVVLPGTSYPETRGSFTNSEGRVQWSNRAFLPLAGKEVTEIITDLNKKLA